MQSQGAADSSAQEELTALREKLAAQSEQLAELIALRLKLEFELATRNEESQQSDIEQSGIAESLAESERKIKALEMRAREFERRHQESQRVCEVLKRRLQSALKPSPADSGDAHQSVGEATASPAGPDSTSRTAPQSENDPVAQWRAAREQALGTGSGNTASPKSRPTAEVSTPSAQKPAQPHGVEGVSVESYMQQLLARSRRSATPDAFWVAPPTAGTTVNPQPEKPEPVSSTTATPVHAGPLPLPEPSHRQDKASVRADLDSLRNVANTAARTAIAKYSSRASREKVLYRGLLATLSLLVTAVLLSSVFWSDGSYLNVGWLAAAASVALGLDVLRASGKLRSLRSEPKQVLAPTKAAPTQSHSASNPGKVD